MITGITLTNFKAFEKINNLRIKPLTVICGVNSSGKSSILHSLLLLKQTLEEKTGYGSLCLDGKYLQYSNLREFTFSLPPSRSAVCSIQLTVTTRDGTEQSARMVFRHKAIPNLPHDNGPVLSEFEWKTGASDTSGLIRLEKGKYYPTGRALLKYSLPDQFVPKGRRSIAFDRFLPQYLDQEVAERRSIKKNDKSRPSILAKIPITVVSRSLGNLIEHIRDDLHEIGYLGPIRAKPHRAYVYYSSSYELDDDGSNAAQVFWLRRNEKVKWQGRNKPLQEAVEEAILLLGMSQKIIPRQSASIVYQLEATTSADTKKRVSIADVGFGYSQSLPIILRGLLAAPQSLLLFEQPEIHLHPSSKANLADLFLEFVKSGNHIIVETHSPELVDRLRLRAIEKPDIVKDINIVFVEPQDTDSKKGAEIRQLELNGDGNFDMWPEGFCDESQKLAREIIIARSKRG